MGRPADEEGANQVVASFPEQIGKFRRILRRHLRIGREQPVLLRKLRRQLANMSSRYTRQPGKKLNVDVAGFHADNYIPLSMLCNITAGC